MRRGKVRGERAEEESATRRKRETERGGRGSEGRRAVAERRSGRRDESGRDWEERGKKVNEGKSRETRRESAGER